MKNPYLNALAASAYVGAVVQLIQYVSSIRHNTPDTVVDGMAALSLLVFSAATMGFLFFYRPVVLLFENKHLDAISFFAKTLVSFGIITAIFFVILTKLSGVI